MTEKSQLTSLRALLVLSVLVTDSADDDQIMRLAAAAASSLGRWRIAGFAVGDSWRGDGDDGAAALPAELGSQLRALPETGGPVTLAQASGWAWA